MLVYGIIIQLMNTGLRLRYEPISTNVPRFYGVKIVYELVACYVPSIDFFDSTLKKQEKE